MPKHSARAQWNTANAKLANKPFAELFKATHWFWCLCPHVYPENGDNFSLDKKDVTCKTCLAQIEAAEQCVHTDPPSALVSEADSTNTAGG